MSKNANTLTDDEIIKTDDILTHEQATAKAVTSLIDPKRTDLLTELGEDDIKIMSALSTVNDRVKSPLLTVFINKFLNFRVSLQRKGRSEVKDIGAASSEADREVSKLKRMLTLGGRV